MGNLSEDGKGVIRNLVSSMLTYQNSMSNSEVVAEPVATYEAPGDTTITAVDSKTGGEISAIQAELQNKADARDFESLNHVVSEHTKQIGTNAENIQKNAASIADLKESKADVNGENIDVGKYAEKLGIGKVEAGNTGLVSGDTVYAALDKKAAYSYVAGGLGSWIPCLRDSPDI